MTESFTTPRQAVAAMIAAGAGFTIRRSSDGLGRSFSYRIQASGNADAAREIMAAVKRKPPQFVEGFRVEVQRITAEDSR